MSLDSFSLHAEVGDRYLTDILSLAVVVRDQRAHHVRKYFHLLLVLFLLRRRSASALCAGPLVWLGSGLMCILCGIMADGVGPSRRLGL